MKTTIETLTFPCEVIDKIKIKKEKCVMGNVQMLLRQHVGAPCAPCVEVGAEVKKGTLIATPTGLRP